MNATAFVKTDRPERYIKQLMSHFSHKITASVGEDGVGRAEFPSGVCILTPTPEGIDMKASADDDEGIDRVRGVVKSHLEGFGKRDDLVVDWQDA